MKFTIIDNTLSGILKIIYSKEKSEERWLLLLILIGFILRIIAALHIGISADDMIKASQSAGIINSGVLSTSSAPPLFYYMTDFAYKIFGYTTFASRFLSLVFGTLLIPLCFLLTKKLFNDKKIALCSAFFITFSNLIITLTIPEESLMVLFFSLLGTYFGLEYLENKRFFYLSMTGIFFGISVLTKYSAPFFILSFLIFSVYYISKKEIIFSKKNIKIFVIFVFILLIFALPFLLFNYFIYKDKGILDVYFSRIIHTENSQKLYGSLAGQGESFFGNVFKPTSYVNLVLLYKTDFIILLFGIIGLYLMFKKEYRDQFIFLIIFFTIPFILQSAGSTLQKHFVFIGFLFSIPAGFSLLKILKKINKNLKFILIFVLVVFMIINLGSQNASPQDYFSQSAASSLKNIINENVKSNDLIIFDTRIYTSQYFWMGTPNHFLNLHQFIDFYGYNENLTKDELSPTNVYIVECAIDDCGWGTIKDQPDLNKSSEEILSALKNNSKFISSIEEKSYSGNELFTNKKIEKYRVYETTIYLNPQLVSQVDYINSFYFAPYLYKNLKSYVYYHEPIGLFENSLYSLSIIIINLSIIFAILSILIIFYYLILPNNLSSQEVPKQIS